MYRWLRLTGTGKSTLVKFIVSALNIDPEDVCYVAYTGKASLVLKEKGCPNAMTAHRLLYQSFPKKDGTFFHKVKRPLDHNYKLIVVDEISMLPQQMWELLLTHHIHVIALGDPGQLPPIGDDNGILADPHIFLDEIMRQAQESEIIRLTMDIREGKPLELYKGSEIQIIDMKDFEEGMYLWADQVLCAKNETRRYINAKMREYTLGTTSPEPLVGDKLICLRNEWECCNDPGDSLVNGSIGYINNIKHFHSYWVPNGLIVDFTPEGCEYGPDTFSNLSIDHKLLTTGEPLVNNKNFSRFPKQFKPKEFDYGYCITTWKAQGSEYDKILVFEENFPYNAEEHAKFLYTAATRAKDRLVIVRAN